MTNNVDFSKEFSLVILLYFADPLSRGCWARVSTVMDIEMGFEGTDFELHLTTICLEICPDISWDMPIKQ